MLRRGGCSTRACFSTSERRRSMTAGTPWTTADSSLRAWCSESAGAARTSAEGAAQGDVQRALLVGRDRRASGRTQPNALRRGIVVEEPTIAVAGGLVRDLRQGFGRRASGAGGPADLHFVEVG